ncbi:hypothetical protein ACFX14_008505 [Malus domestica]|uniref:Uncharacterized protein n=1 Tax=Malus domestica TaxID=3750 RepID=A0A498IK91_MALDO|nr:hypothetical protein DVH24_035114 [Malus domestica]
MFLAQVSQTKKLVPCLENALFRCTKFLLMFSVKIVPQINSIMTTIMKTLALSAGSFPLQQACSKVVPAIALYGIDPTTPEDKKRHIIRSLCTPLSDSLLDPQESFTSGAALCLRGPLLIQIIGVFLQMRWSIGSVRMFLELWRRRLRWSIGLV